MMMKWEHQQRLIISGARAQARAQVEERTPAPPISPKVVAKWSMVKSSLAPSIGSILTQSFGGEQLGWNRFLGDGGDT